MHADGFEAVLDDAGAPAFGVFDVVFVEADGLAAPVGEGFVAVVAPGADEHGGGEDACAHRVGTLYDRSDKFPVA